MPTVTKLSLHRRRSLLISLVMAAAILSPGVAWAERVTCHATGQANGYQVFRLDLQQGGTGMDLDRSGLAAINGVVGQSNYYFTEGIEVIRGSDGALEASALGGVTGQRPRVLVSSGDQEIVDLEAIGGQEMVGPQVPLGWHRDSNTSSLSPGSHYVIGFGFGSGTYDVTFSLAVLPGTGSCQQVTPSGADLIQYDQTDFTSSGRDLRTSGQIYAPGFGSGGNVSLSFPTTRSFFAGYILGAVFHGDFVMTYDTPRYDGTIVRGDIVPVTWPPGPSTFKTTYRGVLPYINIDGWALDLPVV